MRKTAGWKFLWPSITVDRQPGNKAQKNLFGGFFVACAQAAQASNTLRPARYAGSMQRLGMCQKQ